GAVQRRSPHHGTCDVTAVQLTGSARGPEILSHLLFGTPLAWMGTMDASHTVRDIETVRKPGGLAMISSDFFRHALITACLSVALGFSAGATDIPKVSAAPQDYKLGPEDVIE